MPDGGLSTGAVFGGYDRMERTMPPVDMEMAQEALLRGDYDALERYAANALTEPAVQVSGAIEPAIRALYEQGAVVARMSGSGSAVFGVYADEASCRSAAQALIKAYPTCRMIKTAPCGVVIEEV